MVFRRLRVVVFCDGDFWHGRKLDERLAKLAEGHNGAYWAAKIKRNVERDREHDAALRTAGWIVLRYWESEVLRDADRIARSILADLENRSLPAPRRRVTPTDDAQRRPRAAS